MIHIEHFLFFPVVVLLGLVIIALSFRLLFRLFILFLVVVAIWYGVYWLGFVPSPFQVIQHYQEDKPHKTPYTQVH